MLFFESHSAFPYSWEHVTRANWQKYPNEITTHVETVDVLRREIDEKTGILRTERLIGCSQQGPKWFMTLLNTSGKAFVREVSEVDPKKGTFVSRSQNLDFASVLSVLETVKYQRDLKRPLNNTHFSQRATFVSSLSFKRLCRKIEEFSVDRFAQNAQLGRIAFELVLSRLTSNKIES